MRIKHRPKIIGAVTFLAFLSFFLPTHFVHAYWWDLPTFNDLIALFFTSIFGLIAGVIKITSAALNFAVSVRAGGDIPVVATTWKILRDFANMFFIIMLIYMAFATIFDKGKYTFKDMIVRFLIVAVLINFSLVIGILIIDATQVLTNIFLGSIGDIGNRLGQYLSPGQLLPSGPISAASLAGGGLVSLLFAVILASILLFSMLVALAFAIIRVPIIWALLIVSPFAWMSHILPSSESWWKKWWSQFVGWNLFLPVYLFFIYLGLLFLSKRNEIIGAVIQVGTTTNPANIPLANTLTNGLTFNLLFFYIFAAVVMVGGTWAAIQTTSMMGTGFEKGVGWAKWAVKNTPWGKLGSIQNYETAIGQRRDQFKKEGVLGYFGTDKFERKTAQIGSNKLLFGGVKGALDKGVEMEKKRQQEYSNNVPKLQQLATSGSRQQQIAARMRLTQLNVLSKAQVDDTYRLLGGDGSESAEKYVTDIDYGKRSETERKEFMKSLTSIEARKKVAMAMIEKDELDEQQITTLVESLALRTGSGQDILNMADIKEILDKGNKKNLMAVAKVKKSLLGESLKSIDQIIGDSLKNMSDDQLLEAMGSIDFSTVNTDRTDFETALNKVLGKSPKRLEGLAGKAAGDDLINALNVYAKAAREKENGPKIIAEETKQTRAATDLARARVELSDAQNEIRILNEQVDPRYPTSQDNRNILDEIASLEKTRIAKDSETKTHEDKLEKINEKLDSLRSGTPITPWLPQNNIFFLVPTLPQ